MTEPVLLRPYAGVPCPGGGAESGLVRDGFAVSGCRIDLPHGDVRGKALQRKAFRAKKNAAPCIRISIPSIYNGA